jgi:hypothetical protein
MKGGPSPDIAGRRLDLDHVSAHVNQQHGAQGAGRDLREIDHPDAF